MMMNLSRQLLFASLLIILAGCSSDQQVFTNGTIYTSDQQNPWVEAVVVEDERIVYAGDRKGMEAVVKGDATIYDLKGKLLLPGFIDSHVHTFINAVFSNYESVHHAKSHEEVMAILKKYAAENDDDWMFVSGLSTAFYGENINLTKEELDTIDSSKPVIISTADIHSMWLNSKALELYGFTKDMKDVPGGIIRRDKDGNPTGMIGDKAVSDLFKKLPFSKIGVATGLRDNFKAMNALGYTGFMEAFNDGTLFGQLFWGMDMLGQLTMRASLAIYYDQSKSVSEMLAHIENFKSYETDLIKIDTVKIIVDGATLPEIYNDLPLRGKETYPTGLIETKKLTRIVIALTKAGHSIHMHAVGNNASRIGLDAIAAARKAVPNGSSKYSITHLLASHPGSAKRFKELDVIANYQPGFFNPSWSISDLWKEQVRDEILNNSYVVKDFIDAGVTVAASTDFPVQTLRNPIHAIEIGVTRDDPIKPTGKPFQVEQSVNVETWVNAFTINSAKQLGMEKITGSIEVGKMADLIVLDKNIFKTPAKNISDANVLMTMLGGDIIYQNK